MREDQENHMERKRISDEENLMVIERIFEKKKNIHQENLMVTKKIFDRKRNTVTRPRMWGKGSFEKKEGMDPREIFELRNHTKGNTTKNSAL